MTTTENDGLWPRLYDEAAQWRRMAAILHRTQPDTALALQVAAALITHQYHCSTRSLRAATAIVDTLLRRAQDHHCSSSLHTARRIVRIILEQTAPK